MIMKKLLSLIVLSMCFISISNAQENQTVIKETTVKKTVTKGPEIETVIEEKVEEKKGVITVEGSDKMNQEYEEKVIKNEETIIRNEDVELNTENQLDVEKIKLDQEREIENQRGEPTLDLIEVKSIDDSSIDGQQRGTPSKELEVEKEKTVKKPKKDDGKK